MCVYVCMRACMCTCMHAHIQCTYEVCMCLPIQCILCVLSPVCFVVPQSVPENNGGEGKSQFACGLNVPFKRSNSERSIKEGIEESCSSHQPLNAP